MPEYTKMKPAIKKKWLRALRGEGDEVYSQCRKRLTSEDHGFCCLGVLCNISDKGEWSRNGSFGIWHYVLPNGQTQSTVLPHKLKNWR